jgi:hypothetical protein
MKAGRGVNGESSKIFCTTEARRKAKQPLICAEYADQNLRCGFRVVLLSLFPASSFVFSSA